MPNVILHFKNTLNIVSGEIIYVKICCLYCFIIRIYFLFAAWTYQSLVQLKFQRCWLCGHFSRDLGRHCNVCENNYTKSSSLDRAVKRGLTVEKLGMLILFIKGEGVISVINLRTINRDRSFDTINYTMSRLWLQKFVLEFSIQRLWLKMS